MFLASGFWFLVKRCTFVEQTKTLNMKRRYYLILFLIMATMISFSCSRTTSKTITKLESTVNTEDTKPIPAPVVEDTPGAINVSGPAVIVYKTKNDYYDKVPVTLSEDKSMLMSYPAISDLYYNGELALPTRLNDGYLLDNRGITKNVAFLRVTYSSYSRLDMTPPTDLLFQMVLDDDPLVEMYNCGTRNEFQDIVNELNILIDKKKLKKFGNLIK